MMRAWLVLFLVGCEGASHVAGVACSGDADCKLGDVTGKCESTGFCSYPDATCDGNRYGPGAGSGLSETCVTGPATCGAKDQACCANMLCGTNLACTASTMTCTCGDKDGPCCDGTTCGANLACEAGACTCGALGDPCCGGSTCNTGLTCSGGTCGGSVLAIATGEGHMCALRSDHSVSCWGFDWKPYASDVIGMSTPVIASHTPFTIPGLSDVEAIRAGGKHTCARKTDGTLWCWGHNENGQLGDGTTTSSVTAVQVAGLTGVTLFDAGFVHTCAVGMYMGTQGVWCWGHGTMGSHASKLRDPNMGRLGNGDLLDHLTPTRVDLTAATSGGQTVRSLSTGLHHTCVALSDKTVWCWGANAQGQLGNGNTTSTKVPVAADLSGVTIPVGVTIEEVAVTKAHSSGVTCLRLSNGAVYCWGDGIHGEFGDGTSISPTPPAARLTPTTPVTTTSLGSATFVQLAAGGAFVCGRDSSGAVWCWGFGYMGALGNNSQGDQTAPVQVMNLTGATQLDVGHRNACAIDGASQLFCWGNNRRSRMTNALPPGAVLTATKVPL